jgi:formylglycine-generating enzyme required for sulfatase activity/predicted Ser/Thr protein kinase
MAPEDRYQIVRKLGEGAMGVVYLSNDTWLKREVAIKRIKPRDGQDPQERGKAVQRLIREAQAAAGLKHPHIVAVYDVIPDESSPSIIMEYVRGKSLAEAAPWGVPAERSFALRVLQECAGALDFAHSRRRVHRDFKPANVMLDEAGSALIMDFGIAKMLDSPTDSTHGKVTGTFEYMSPEQMNGAAVDGRSDQYSLAVVAYQLLTGCRVFDAPDLGTLISMALLQPPPPASGRNSRLPEAVDAVFWKALAKKAAERYDSCTEFVTGLEARLLAAGPPKPSQDDIGTVKNQALTVPITRKTGVVRVNQIDGQRFLWIPGGTFLMGCSPGDAECYDDEKPAHEVTLSRGFWMGESPVTEGAYKRYAEAKGQSMPVPLHLDLQETTAGDENLPAASVTWDEAASYCKWAGGRLPTEAEWEYAARAGATGARYGNLDDIAWCRSNSAGPTPVGLKQPNGFGLSDMLGNVWEWTADWYGEEYYKAGEKIDPQGPPKGTTRTLRGGSWYDYPRSARASGRNRLGPGYRYDVIGFRCVMDSV